MDSVLHGLSWLEYSSVEIHTDGQAPPVLADCRNCAVPYRLLHTRRARCAAITSFHVLVAAKCCQTPVDLYPEQHGATSILVALFE